MLALYLPDHVFIHHKRTYRCDTLQSVAHYTYRIRFNLVPDNVSIPFNVPIQFLDSINTWRLMICMLYIQIICIYNKYNIFYKNKNVKLPYFVRILNVILKWNIVHVKWHLPNFIWLYIQFAWARSRAPLWRIIYIYIDYRVHIYILKYSYTFIAKQNPCRSVPT